MISMKKCSTLVCKAGGPQEKHPCNSQKPEKYESHKPLDLVLTESLSHLGKWGIHTLPKAGCQVAHVLPPATVANSAFGTAEPL